MARNNLTTKVYKNKVFAKGDGEFIRTVPMEGDEEPYIGYIKTTIGESKVPYDNDIVFEVLVNGEEITEKEYNDAKLIAVNKL